MDHIGHEPWSFIELDDGIGVGHIFSKRGIRGLAHDGEGVQAAFASCLLPLPSRL
jgi:hypothetical protein